MDAWLGMEEADILRYTSFGMIAAGVLAAVLLQWIDAPYGRYQVKASPLWGMAVDNRVAWLLQELPSFAFAVWGWYTADPEAFGAANRVLLGLYLLHYTHRAWVFPLRMRGGKPTPLSVFLLAMVYCLVNGYLQSRFLAAHATFAAGWTEAPQFLAGVAMFFAGMYINMDADSILRNLRRGPADKGYYIPRGGMFDFVSGANFFGEIVEWTGYALASGFALPPVAFAVFTALNIGPRALQHHRDYRARFNGSKGKEAYPADRKALIPFLL
ncbi:hypothetical protein FNF27_02595 [Cafeteria roenbergensis]|uniref:3-oxo-5-alpha-steroid 4-dehydrogenase 1 n=2 Tax=Cafeteria roenbergensis TaxID=33653 RepID=A0A5A8D8N7_CAFRO|nr:hypothetical protein FNF31_07124 [Cafeteria roenbergensis]KAA0161545.1 hypothetical protein FNF28_05002 [Cafeteria roenbergensis]KAA0175874.1 hypothetical protein FNF27_02595 [Cafeteria roenbergensis]